MVANGVTAHTGILTNFIIAAELRRNFRRSQIRPCALPLDGLHLHLVGFGAFGGENVLSLEVAVHHDDGGSVPVNVADNDGHGGQPRQLTGVFAAVTCDQFIAAVLPWPRQRGDEDAVLLDAFGGFLHGRILSHLKGVIRERMQLRERNLNNYFLLRFRLFGWRGLFARFLLHVFFRHCVPPVGI